MQVTFTKKEPPKWLLDMWKALLAELSQYPGVKAE
jgi:hypothetical protein